ncbi:MAG: PQQ-dependent sugar dehydrogenase [Gemmatimonadales bacterium]|jgi:glucose/arabinose dehydrogenase|nr:MAG: PQQ-dependent sugar dehydrogenase [Gemmatimonadales bacterium]
MSRAPRTLLAGAFLLAASPALGQDVHRTAYHDYRVVTVADGLVNPWSIAFLPGGDMLVTERPGRLRIVRNGSLLPNPVDGVPEVFARGQGGLLDVVPHPDFASNRLLYLSYSKPLGGDESTTAVVRGRFEGDRLTGVEEVFEAQTRGRGHYGSRLVFDGGGHLFITVGDRQAPPRGDLESHPAQDVSNHHGVVLRINEDGTVPDDNPFVGQEGALPEIWSFGHRNAQGMTRNPATGDLWITEHGPQGGDELNLVQPGLNYGWPVVGYGVNYGSGARIHESTTREGMENPRHVWVPSIGTSGLTVYTGGAFPGWQGDLFAGGLSGEVLYRLEMDGQEVIVRENVLHGVGRIRDVRQGPDGFLYVAVDHRGGNPTPILRLEPVN